ncbi:hypothetical protein JQ580_10545 [Bradyrhizobium japonicum]|jgi:hypothetical protein|nr:hypothetical protein [Bradyrhizobium japonicum]MBR0991148.1 hypothetical protein [Bradyrhizobium japonicum]
MAGLVPGITFFCACGKGVDDRDKPDHDDVDAHGLNLTTRHRDETA